MYHIAFNSTELPRGAEIEVDGLGVFKNKSEYDVSKDDAEAYRQRHVQQTSEYDKDGNLIVTTEPGPTLLQAFHGREDVVVTNVPGETPPEETKPAPPPPDQTETVKPQNNPDKPAKGSDK